MEDGNIILSFRGEITADLVSSILKMIEEKLESEEDEVKKRRKVYNVLVETLQNLYHHIDSFPLKQGEKPGANRRTAVFMIGKKDGEYDIISANYIAKENIPPLQDRLEKINSLDKEGLREYYQEVLTNGEVSIHGGGGLGMIDIARKSGNKLRFGFHEVNEDFSFFTLKIKI